MLSRAPFGRPLLAGHLTVGYVAHHEFIDCLFIPLQQPIESYARKTKWPSIWWRITTFTRLGITFS